MKQRRVTLLYAGTSDFVLHHMWVSNFSESNDSVPDFCFLEENGQNTFSKPTNMKTVFLLGNRETLISTVV